MDGDTASAWERSGMATAAMTAQRHVLARGLPPMLALVLAPLAVWGGAAAAAGGSIDLGAADEVVFAQPTVQVGVTARGRLLDLEPNNEFLLDTGASGILLAKTASDDLTAAGLQTVATYTDFGVAGAAETRVSEPCTFFFAGADGVPLSLSGVRLQASQQELGTYPGIGGMPLMMGRTVSFDLSQQANMNAPAMTVAFNAPIASSAAHRYAVPLTMVTFPQTGQQNPGDPLPENAPLPFAAVSVRSGAAVQQGSFLLDTGAQQCILSSSMAFALGLDRDGDGTFDGEATSFQTVSGVGGQAQIPVLTIDALSLPTAGGVDIVQRDVSVGIIDIDPSIAGVLGFNFLNKGWEVYAVNMFLGLDPQGPPGAFQRIDLDFRAAAATGQGQMFLTVTPQFDVVIVPEPAGLAGVAIALVAMLARLRCRR